MGSETQQDDAMYSHRSLTRSFSASAAMRAGLQGARLKFFTLHFLERLQLGVDGVAF